MRDAVCVCGMAGGRISVLVTAFRIWPNYGLNCGGVRVSRLSYIGSAAPAPARRVGR